MALDFATLASASHLSKEDRRAYLKAMERDQREAAERAARRLAQHPSRQWKA